LKGPANGFRESLHPGQHDIEIRAEGYQGHREMVSVPTGNEKIMEIALVALPRPPQPTGVLALHVSPADAVLTLDGNTVGPAADFRREIAAGNHEVEISADGYQTQSQTLTVPAGGEESVQLALTRLPPPKGILAVQVSPDSAVLAIDGKKIGPAAAFRQEIAAGNHEVEISAEGYQSQRQTVAVPAGGEKSAQFALVRLPPPKGILALQVSPETAVLTIDGKQAGSAAAFRREISAGDHEVVISADAYQSQRQTVKVPAGGEKRVQVALARLPPPMGILALQVSPETAVLTIDGKQAGPAAAFRQEISAGDHEVVISADGYQRQRQTVTVPAGGEKSVQVALARPPPPMGILALQVSPETAVLTIDGKQAGSAAAFRQEISAGNHELEISAEGYQSRREAITVPAGGEKNMELALVTLAPPPPTTGTLELEVSPPAAILTIDGARIGNASGFRRELSAGQHRIEISASGYQEIKRTLDIVAGKVMPMRFELAAAPAPRSSTVRPPRRSSPATEPVPIREPIPNRYPAPVAPMPAPPAYSPPSSSPAPSPGAPKPSMPPP
jgi:uncharacterized protein YegP (UPF0339 family)